MYNLHHLKGQGYYLKSRYPEVRLIQCLPDSNKGLNKDFWIVSEEWHDGLFCPTREGTPGMVLGLSDLFVLKFLFNSRYFLLMIFFVSLNDFADKNVAVPNFNLVNESSLDKILKAEVFVHSDDQLRAAHIILGYTPISKTFQALKCIIKARDPRLHRISVVAPGFLISGLIPEGVFTTTPIPEGVPKVEASSSRPINKEEEEEKEKEEGETF